LKGFFAISKIHYFLLQVFLGLITFYKNLIRVFIEILSLLPLLNLFIYDYYIVLFRIVIFEKYGEKLYF